MGTESDDYTDTERTYQEVVAGDDRPDHVKQRGPPKVVSQLSCHFDHLGRSL